MRRADYPVAGATNAYVQRDQPPGVPPLELTGERTLPDVPAENYWFRRHLAVYEWIGARVIGRHVIDMACGEGYGSEVLSRSAASVVGVDANPEAHEHARRRYQRQNLSFERGMVETHGEPGGFDAVVFLQTIEHVQDPVAVLAHFRSLLAPGRRRLHLDPEPADAGAAGSPEVRQPVAPQGVPGGRVPRPVRDGVRSRGAAGGLSRPQAAAA